MSYGVEWHLNWENETDWKSSMENIPDWDIVVAYSFSGDMEKVSEEN